MRARNGEAQSVRALLGFLSNNTRKGTIDMNIVAKSNYNFQGFVFNPVAEGGSVWFTSTELAKSLGYKKTDAISQIYARNADEFSESMSLTLNMRVNGINNSLRNKSVRVYSLRGAHLVAMFATTAKAKEFRRWVLDILDHEVVNSPIVKQFSDKELQSLCWMWKNTTRMISHIADIEPFLRVAEHRLAPAYYSMAREYCRNTDEVRHLLERETLHVPVNVFTQDNWRVLNSLRLGSIQ